jgi:ATP-dependent Lhr-like helicase
VPWNSLWKTEAAFLPVLTLLHAQPATTIGVLYIGPIKALINDQFDRLNNLLQEAEIPVWHWHGDVSQSRKKQLLKTLTAFFKLHQNL